MTYHAEMSPQLLTTGAEDPLLGYPQRWELMRWYLCWRKYAYPSEGIALLIAEARPEGYAHYPCPLDATHWHIGRGGGGNSSKKRYIQAKRVYRKAVRDEKIEAYRVVREEEERARERTAVGALAD